MGFFLDGDIFYKKNKDQMLLRCVNADEAKKIVHEIHEGVYGTHANGHVMARQIMRIGYYWMTLENDCISYVRKCHKLIKREANATSDWVVVNTMKGMYMSCQDRHLPSALVRILEKDGLPAPSQWIKEMLEQVYELLKVGFCILLFFVRCMGILGIVNWCFDVFKYI